MRISILVFFFFFVLVVFPLKASTNEINHIHLLNIKSAITPASYDYLNYQLGRTHPNSLIIIKMNTPGGLLTTTKDIVSLIAKQKNPVAIWITPEGGGAASAGAIIASAANFIFMSPGTNIGAATPVSFGSDIQSDSKQKLINDLASLIRSMGQLRNRPSLPFENMVRTASSYTDQEALDLKIIDGITSNLSEIIRVLETKNYKFSQVEIHKMEPTLGQKLLEIIADPSLAYFLFLLGVALVYFEFQAPGGFIAGSIGSCLILLSGIAFQVLPLNWGAMGLIALGIILLILEIFIVSYGVLSFSGLAAFIAGSLFLYHNEEGFISVDYSLLISLLAGVFTSAGILIWTLYRYQKKQSQQINFFSPLYSTGLVLNLHPLQVKVKGEIWKAQSADELKMGDEVKIIEVVEKELIVIVNKI
ncbi:MAG: nodulation protein NfeD [Bacteriovoracaceae bacterium]